MLVNAFLAARNGEGSEGHSKCPIMGIQTSGAMEDGDHLVVLEPFKGRGENNKEGTFLQESSKLKVTH